MPRTYPLPEGTVEGHLIIVPVKARVPLVLTFLSASARDKHLAELKKKHPYAKAGRCALLPVGSKFYRVSLVPTKLSGLHDHQVALFRPCSKVEDRNFEPSTKRPTGVNQ